MLLVILGICIVMVVVGVLIYCKNRFKGLENVGKAIAAIGAALGVAIVIAIIFVGVAVSKGAVLDEKVIMYTEENIAIEQRIADVVAQYQVYERGIFTEVTPDSAITLVALYPDLKSDTLVAAQLEAYVANNNVIKQLKASAIDLTVDRWWLYFGQ